MGCTGGCAEDQRSGGRLHTVVRLLCGFKRTEILGRLVELAQTERAAPFVDERLPFYRLHAQQWLVIALARAAIDDPQPLVPHFDFIVAVALREQPHILIRSFAAEAALSLVDSGLVGSNAPLGDELSEINKSWVPPRGPKMGVCFDEQPSVNDDAGLYFGLDIGPYWFSALARCFEITQADVECAARKLIKDEWGYSRKARWTGIRARNAASSTRWKRITHIDYYPGQTTYIFICLTTQ